MKTDDFSKGKRGPVVRVPENKERITIRLDSDVLNWFRNQVESAGGGNYQTMINDVLRGYIEAKSPTMETMLRRVVREELQAAQISRA